MSAIESYLPQVGSPLFYPAVEEVVSLWEANPTATYLQVVFQYLVNGLMSIDVYDENAWYEHVGSSSPSSVLEEWAPPPFVPNVASEAVVAFCTGKFPHQRVDKCPGGNRCSDATCQLFHGPLCEFHAGMKVHFAGPRRGQKMTCGKGLACPFDHASAELRAARVAAGLAEKRFRYAPSLKTEADIFAVFPTIEWRFADVYTYGGLSPAEMDLLEVCLERSPELGVVALEGGLQIATCDFMDSRFLPDAPAFVIPAPKAEDGWESAPARRR